MVIKHAHQRDVVSLLLSKRLGSTTKAHLGPSIFAESPQKDLISDASIVVLSIAVAKVQSATIMILVTLGSMIGLTISRSI